MRIFLLCFLSCVVTLSASRLEAQTQIKFYTTMGNFVVTMSDSLTPITSGNFIDLADSGYYDGVIFHRVIDNFMIQGGDPTGTGTGGPGYTIPDEFDSTGTLSNVQRAIAMANTGAPNSGGSQFFINLVNNTYLDFDNPPFTSAHPIFGMVTDSFEVVQAIGDVAVNGQNRPIVDVVMDSLRILVPIDTTIGDTTVNDTTINDTTVNDTTVNDSINSIAFVQSSQMKVKVFPNPIADMAVVTVDAPVAGEARFAIMDQMGREVSAFERQLRKGMNRFTGLGLDRSSLSSGIYFLRIQSGDSISQFRFIITE